MRKHNQPKDLEEASLSRREFFRSSSVAAAGAVFTACAHSQPPTAPLAAPPPAAPLAQPADPPSPMIQSYRTLGRTGFKVSDIGMGCGQVDTADVVRLAYDRGINFFDTAERYGNGDSERKIGEAMSFIQRDKIFLITKLGIEKEESEARIRQRFASCLERLRTGYVDALYMHSVTDVAMVKHAGFHAAVAKLKADGKVRYCGISSHGPRGKDGDSMEQVLLSAAEDGRFDVMLLVYNFMNREPGERVLARCQEKQIGTTLMKTAPRTLEVEVFDPLTPNPDQARWLKVLMERGDTREQAIAKIQERTALEQEELKKNRPHIDAFMKQYGILKPEDLAQKAVQWTLQNAAVNTVCVSLPNFDLIEQYAPLSGQRLTRAENRMLLDYAAIYRSDYCRHGCSACVHHCPRQVPVSTVMRYVYYSRFQGRKGDARQKYAALAGRDASLCQSCPGWCQTACPYGVQIQPQMRAAHHLLALTPSRRWG